MVTLICAGGSGVRVLEAALHLCAAGLGPRLLRTFVVDPDDANGNVDRARRLVDRYQECSIGFRANQQPFFGTQLDLLTSSQGLRVWRPVNPKQKFRDVLNYAGLSSERQDIVHLLLTDDELKMPMNVGFRGHPALGAAALSLLPLYKKDELWTQVADVIQRDLNLGETRVVIAGSIFGGTGASTLHPLVRYLRGLPQNNADKFKIAAVALVPYFEFSATQAAIESGHAETEVAAQAEWFPLASRAAAEYYEHLRETGDWSFDAMYWLGDDSPVKFSYSKGGPEQTNPAHFVDLLAAFAALDFFESPPPSKSCYYSGPQQNAEIREGNVLTWDDIPMSSVDRRDSRRKALHQFHLMGCAHLGFYGPLLKDPRLHKRPHYVPWYRDLFADGPQALSSRDNQARLDSLTSYFRDFYFPWVDEIHSLGQDRIRLFNRTAWRNGNATIDIQTNRLGNLWYPDSAREHGWDTVDALFSETVRVSARSSGAENLAALYFSILGHAAEAIVSTKETGTAPAEGH